MRLVDRVICDASDSCSLVWHVANTEFNHDPALLPKQGQEGRAPSLQDSQRHFGLQTCRFKITPLQLDQETLLDEPRSATAIQRIWWASKEFEQTHPDLLKLLKAATQAKPSKWKQIADRHAFVDTQQIVVAKHASLTMIMYHCCATSATPVP